MTVYVCVMSLGQQIPQNKLIINDNYHTLSLLSPYSSTSSTVGSFSLIKTAKAGSEKTYNNTLEQLLFGQIQESVLKRQNKWVSQ